MKVLGINCSPRKGGNTEILIKEVFKALEKEGIEAELFQIGGEYGVASQEDKDKRQK